MCWCSPAACSCPGGSPTRYGRRRVFALGLGLFTAASLACGLAPGAGALVAARAVQGLGAALTAPAALALIVDAFPTAIVSARRRLDRGRRGRRCAPGSCSAA